jgi:hypothetical protein
MKRLFLARISADLGYEFIGALRIVKCPVA